MPVALIDYGAGNLHSVAKALRAAGAEVQLCQDAMEVTKASHIVLPGVGAFADCIAGLQALPGMVEALQEAVYGRQVPFLGICVGMQMLFEHSAEHGRHAGLGWLKGEVVALQPTASERVPHMGWNNLEYINGKPGADVYFVHSYHCRAAADDTLAVVHDGPQRMVAMVRRGNILGMQFHPEKSQQAGLRLLRDFVEGRA